MMRSTASSLTVNLQASAGGIGPEAARWRRRAIATGRWGEPLQPPGREERGSARWDAHRLDLAAQDTPAGVQALGQSLGIVVGHSTSRETLPD